MIRSVHVVFLLLACAGCGRGWEQDPGLFVSTIAEAAHTNAGRLHNDREDAPYKGKAVRWTLKFKQLVQGEKGPTVEFDLEPLGIRQKFFESKYPVMLVFKPDPSAVAEWQRTPPGTVATFGGTIEGVLFVRMTPGDGPNVSYDVELASLQGVRPLNEKGR
jgi:hypothetical protein